jgi:hypothetical protein
LSAAEERDVAEALLLSLQGGWREEEGAVAAVAEAEREAEEEGAQEEEEEEKGGAEAARDTRDGCQSLYRLRIPSLLVIRLLLPPLSAYLLTRPSSLSSSSSCRCE